MSIKEPVFPLRVFIFFNAVPPIINKGDLLGPGLSPKEVKIKVNNTLTLECEAYAIPSASLSWYKDGQASHMVFAFIFPLQIVS